MDDNLPEKIVTYSCIVLFLSLIFILIFGACQDHKVEGYYISGDGKEGNGLSITADIDWLMDVEISLDRNISYSETIQLCSDMNKSLKESN